MTSPALSLQEAMRAKLLSHAPLTLLLGGAHVHEEMPRGAQGPFVSFDAIETRDWSVAGQKAHEHFVTLLVKTQSRSRRLALQILDEIEAALDDASLSLAGHRLVNLRLTFWSVTRQADAFGASLRFRAATEPL